MSFLSPKQQHQSTECCVFHIIYVGHYSVLHIMTELCYSSQLFFIYATLTADHEHHKTMKPHYKASYSYVMII